MPARTRSATSSPVKKTPVAMPNVVTEDDHDPVKILVAPANISTIARLVLLRHPRDASYKQYLFCPQRGLFELKQTIAPVPEPRSILFAPPSIPLGNATNSSEGEPFTNGYFNKQAEVLTATPYDLAFVLLKVIAPRTANAAKNPFQPLEDLIDVPDNDDKGFPYVAKEGQGLVRASMTKICDMVDAGGEEMYRYNEEKVLQWVLEKAQNVVRSGLPASLEERFVTRVLEAPMLTMRREDTTVSITVEPASNEEAVAQTDSFDSESATSVTGSAVFSQVSATSTIVTEVEDAVPGNVMHLQRLRTAFNFINATCLPAYVTARLTSQLSEKSSPVDFQPLEEYLKRLATLRVEAASLRSLTDFSKKRSLEEEEAAEDRAEKKRKQDDEEKKRKANESRGVRDLKKVNVTGMKKMSDFFSKKPTTAKAKS